MAVLLILYLQEDYLHDKMHGTWRIYSVEPHKLYRVSMGPALVWIAVLDAGYVDVSFSMEAIQHLIYAQQKKS